MSKPFAYRTVNSIGVQYIKPTLKSLLLAMSGEPASSKVGVFILPVYEQDTTVTQIRVDDFIIKNDLYESIIKEVDRKIDKALADLSSEMLQDSNRLPSKNMIFDMAIRNRTYSWDMNKISALTI